MLVRLFYVSTAAGPQTATVSESIIVSSRGNNQNQNISGILCQGRGIYLQVLEGTRDKVNDLYNQILRDPRHSRVELLSYEYITKRQFPDWSMALVDLNSQEVSVALQNSDFDPYATDGDTMTKILADLLASKISVK
ncbi:BLUF domain-containing protein [Polynucleobacter antarcticus]|uniref:BLUF domain-containing protein n=1 Tax=Polynucleobacter antarcticus TaxID=1743162 RepID=A0A6M9PJ54_9BURK|nr:BLUF domain-containing protein [Polynucleobacter antarcticus]QKM62184.1 hypothetical protein DCO16_03285 [Polynucleobacter antarcticus]